MIIQSIKISNILSFEQKDNIDDCQEISFNDKLNIIIGPNGSGKSNFLEIINKIFRNALFKACKYNSKKIAEHKQNNVISLRDTIIIEHREFSLAKNRDSKKGDQHVILKIKLSKDDKENLKFILQKKDKINEYIKKFVNEDIIFTNLDENELSNCNEITISFKNSTQNQMVIEPLTSPMENFMVTYLQYFNVLQNLILLVNDEKIENWSILKNTFALISGYRNYNSVALNFGIQPDKQRILQELKMKFLDETTREANANEPLVFSYVTAKIGYSYHELAHFEGRKCRNLVEQLNDETFVEINKTLANVMKMKLDIVEPDPYQLGGFFQFKKIKSKEIVHSQELSAGEKGILHFIYSIHGYEIKNGVMVIDEPELHLHPQLQQKYVEILKEYSEREGIQFIIATHSPMFVTPETVEGLHIFHIINKFTVVTTPNIDTKKDKIDDKDLVRFLNYTNNAKIFFADKVLMVEGETDEYFFQTFLKKYNQEINADPDSEKKKIKPLENIEFLDIRGTSNYFDWNTFLKKCEIDNYFVGDLDVILRKDFHIMTNSIKEELRKKFFAKPEIIRRMKTDSTYEKSKDQKNDFLKFIKTQDEWSSIESKLQELQTNGIFILKEGDLEKYIGNTVKGRLTNVVEFCKNQFEGWYASNDSQINEIKKTFQLISS